MEFQEHVMNLFEIMSSDELNIAKMSSIIKYIDGIASSDVNDIQSNVDVIHLYVSCTFTLCTGMLRNMAERHAEFIGPYEMGILPIYSESFVYLDLFEYYRTTRTLEYAEFEEQINDITNDIQSFQRTIEEHFREHPFSLKDRRYVRVHLNAAKRARATLDII
jgi:hypothetical protein